MATFRDPVAGAVQRYAMGLFGVQLGSDYMGLVKSQIASSNAPTILGQIADVFNTYYVLNFSAAPAAAVINNVLVNLGIEAGKNGLVEADVEVARAYVQNELSAVPADALGVAVFNVLNKFAALTTDPVFGAAANAWNGNVVAAEQYAVDHADNANIGTVVTAFVLTTGNDNLTGSAQNDTFVANLNANANTLQSGDVVEGGDGYDQLIATLAQTPFSITPTVKWVESISIQAQASTWGDNADNNVQGETAITVDFGRVQGVKVIENTNSRADLIVEDVRILDSEKTKDITIVMRETDPGNVDYGVYFDQNSLRNVSSATSQVNLRVLDTYAVAQGKAELLDSPYGSFTFYYSLAGADPVKVTLESQAMQDAQTLEELKDALQVAVDALNLGQVSVELGSTYTVKDSVTGKDVQGREIVMSTSGDVTFNTNGAGSGWKATDTVPAISGLYTSFQTPDVSKSTELVTSTIVLDDVGRGSTGGDLVVGGLSVGETSDSNGVGRFEITVEDNSKLRSIESTNNFLQEVTIKNGTTTRVDNAYNENAKDSGNLTVNGDVDPQNDVGNTALPGAENHGNDFGFTDVRLIDGSAMTGKFEFTAGLTAAALDKYLNLVDTGANPATDNIAVAYSGGANNDTISVNIDADVAASNSNINPGREDFTFAIKGNAGDDKIELSIIGEAAAPVPVFIWADTNGDGFLDTRVPTGAVTGNTGVGQAWYANQKLNNNVTIDGGAGDDTIRKPGAGDANILGGEGNDTIYAENTGSNAVWVLNALNTNLADLRSSDNTQHDVGTAGAKVAVTFKGFTTAVAVDVAKSADNQSSDLQINQAIKAAINNDAVLSKLLVAEDGPANTLVVTSLIDGAQVVTDLKVDVQKSGAAIAYDPVLAVVGSASTNVSDNTITGGLDNDVIVLGTQANSNDTLVYAGYNNGTDTVVNFDTGNHTFTTDINSGRQESFTVTFKDITASVGETLTFDGVTVNLNDGAAGLVPAADVALAFAEQYGSNGAANWTVAYSAGSKSVTLTANEGLTPAPLSFGGNVATDVVTADFDFSTAANDGTATVGDYVQGMEASSLVDTATTFTLDFDAPLNGTAVIATADSSITYTYEGATINYKAGDGAVTLADAFAKATYADWTATLNADATSVTFTAKVTGSTVAVPAAPVAVNGVDPIQTLTSLGAKFGGGVYTVTGNVGNAGIDHIDFSSYDAVGVLVGGVLVAGVAAANGDEYVLLKESTTNKGEYAVEVYTEAGATDTLVGKVGVIDFGATQDFQATNFIL